MMFAIREKLDNFAIFVPGGHDFVPKNDRNISDYFFTIFRMPLAACLCEAQEPN